MANYLVTDTELTSIADAVREKSGTTADLEFPTEFISAIAAISGGSFEYLGQDTFKVETEPTSTASSVGSYEFNFTLPHTFPMVFLIIIKSDRNSGLKEEYFISVFTSKSTKTEGRVLIGDGLSTSSLYGVYPSSGSADVQIGKLTLVISAKASASLGLMVGNYSIDVYLLN